MKSDRASYGFLKVFPNLDFAGMNASETKIDVIETVKKKLLIKEENEDEPTENLNDYTTKEKLRKIKG